MNETDCLDCEYSFNNGEVRHDWKCSKGHKIPCDENGIVLSLELECEDFICEVIT